MKIKGAIALIVALLFIVAVAWVGITVYDSLSNVDLNPNAESLRKFIQPEFDTQSLTEVNNRVDNLDVEPDVFHKLEDEGIPGVERPTEQ